MSPYYHGYVPDFKLSSDDTMGIQRMYGKKPTGGGDKNYGRIGTATQSPVASDMTDYCVNSRIDAATLHIESNRYVMYVFQDSACVAMNPANGIIDGDPRSISSVWSGITGSIDASLHLHGTSRIPAYTVLIQGANYYLYTADRTPVAGNPRPLTDFGLPSSLPSVDAAFVWDGDNRIYVITGQYCSANNLMQHHMIMTECPDLWRCSYEVMNLT